MVDGRIRVTRAPGQPEWDIVAGTGFLVAIEAPAPDASLVGYVGLAVDGRPSLEALVAAMPPAGGAGHSVALAWWPAVGETPEGPETRADQGRGRLDEVTLVVRGAAAVELATRSGARRLEAGDVHPWRLAEFDGVESLRMSVVGDQRAPVGRPRGGRIDLSRTEVLHAHGLPVRATAADWTSAAAVSAERSGAAEVDTRFAGLPARGDEAEDDEPASPAARHVMRYRVDGGRDRDIRSARVVLGRRPLGSRSGQDEVELVALSEASADVSGSHLELRAEGRRLVATDLNSTNGTEVRRGSRMHRMRAGESIVVFPGTLLRLGRDTIVEILPPRIDPPEDLDRQAPA